MRRGVRTSGVIVEAEAYIGESDPACHAAPGPTRRNAPLYGPPGYAYVYLNYGIHSLVNVVTEATGAPAAVLIRALEPLAGIDVMRRRRGRPVNERRAQPPSAMAVDRLCRGPGNLTLAMGIGLSENMADLCGNRLFVEDGGAFTRTAGLERTHRDQRRDGTAVAGVRAGSPGCVVAAMELLGG